MIHIATPAESAPALELTPLIDIIFIVVVFLLLTANSRLLSLPVDLPDSDTSLAVAEPAAPLVITLRREAPQWLLGERAFADWPALRAALGEALANGSADVVIATGEDVAVAPLLQLMAWLNSRQVASTQVLMESQPQ